MKVDMSRLCVLAFVLILLQIQCLASKYITCYPRPCSAYYLANFQRNQQVDPTTENQLNGVNFSSLQTQRINRFSTEILWSLVDSHQNDDTNLIVSPFSIWSVMLLAAEGASSRTYDQIKRALFLPNDLRESQSMYKNVEKLLSTNRSGIELSVNQGLFTHSRYHVQPSYAYKLTNEYEATYLPVNFQERDEAAKIINDYLSDRTNGQIKDVVNADDLTETKLVLTSSILFKGRWKFPFDSDSTIPLPFFRENGELIGDVPMMTKKSVMRYAYIGRLSATVVELPYGDPQGDDSLTNHRFSMLLIHPNGPLNEAFRALRTFDVAQIFQKLSAYGNRYEEIDLTVPKFEINSNLNLKPTLQQMGVRDIFIPGDANLSKMFTDRADQPYLSHIIHKARIQVNEAGTIASAVTVADFSFKSLSDDITFNRPFGYLIVDQLTTSILFAGQVKNPLKSS